MCGDTTYMKVQSGMGKLGGLSHSQPTTKLGIDDQEQRPQELAWMVRASLELVSSDLASLELVSRGWV